MNKRKGTKLVTQLTRRLAIVAVAVMSLWAVLFYSVVVQEVDDETDDQLETLAEEIIVRDLAGDTLPAKSSGMNNQYFLTEVSAEYAQSHPHVQYEDRDVFVEAKNETEPARVLTYIYKRGNGTWGRIEVSTPTIEKAELREAIAVSIGILFLTLIISIVVLNFTVVRRSMRPLHKLLSWLEQYRPGDKVSALDNPTNIREFAWLNEVSESAIQRSEQLHQQQKQFIGNASHEMQTPLAISIGRLEMMMDDDGLNQQQLGELVKVHHTLSHLSRMNRSLLLLSKIDGAQFSERKPIDINALAKRYLPDYTQVYAHRGIEVEVQEQGHLVIEMDESLAVALLTNLLKNAFVHASEGDTLYLRISDRGFTVENTAHDGPLDASLIFNRFYHTSGNAQSTGLGLSIVKSICNLYKINVAYHHRDGRHVFEVTV